MNSVRLAQFAAACFGLALIVLVLAALLALLALLAPAAEGSPLGTGSNPTLRVILPDGTEFAACGMRIGPMSVDQPRLVDFDLCPTIFSNGFEP